MTRLAAGSFLGAAATLAIFFPAAGWMFSLPAKLTLSALMVIVSFYPFNMIQGFKYWIYLHLVTFAMGGIVFALSLLGMPVSWGHGFVIAPTKPVMLAVAALLVIAAVRGLENHRSYRNWISSCSGRMVFKLSEKTVEIPVVVDTGNVVREPITGLPVVIAPSSLMQEILPKEILESCSTEKIIDAVSLFPDLVNCFCIVPFQALGSGKGILAGFRINSAVLVLERQTYSLCPMVLAVSDSSWGNHGANALLPGSVIISDN